MNAGAAQVDILATAFESDEFLEQLEAQHRIKPEVREASNIGSPASVCAHHRGGLGLRPIFRLPRVQPCRKAIVFKTVNPSSASKPFSRPYPLDFIPPKGSSTPPAAP
jgi:hypothetical protein